MRFVLLALLPLLIPPAVSAAPADFVDAETLRGLKFPAGGRPAPALAAEYLERTDSPGEAAAQVLAAERSGEVPRAEAAGALAQIRAYHALAPYARAEFIARERKRGWTLDRFNTFWLDQAETMLERGEYADAERALRRTGGPFSAEIRTRRYSLWSRVYLHRRNFAGAVAALDQQNAIAGDGLFEHYNLGLSMLRSDNAPQGLALLDAIGTLPLETEEHRALRDRVNLLMGWHWLRENQGGTAREYFKRVRLDGPFSNMALLGLGWAELAADGKQQTARFKRRVLCEPVETPPDALMRLLFDRYAPCRPGEKSGVFPFEHRFAFDPSAKGVGRYDAALRWWGTLTQRGAHDPAVQEALVAAAYAQQRRREQDTAERAYRLAITRFEAEAARLAALAEALQASGDPVAVVETRALPAEFAGVRGSVAYRRLIADRESLRQTGRALDATAHDLERAPDEAEALHARLHRQREQLAATREALDAALGRLLREDIAARRERLDHYHSRARLALAQLYDRRTE